MSEEIDDKQFREFVEGEKKLIALMNEKAKSERAKSENLPRGVTVEPQSLIYTASVILEQLASLREQTLALYEVLFDVAKFLDNIEKQDVVGTTKQLREAFKKNEKTFRFMEFLRTDFAPPTDKS